MMVIEGTSPLVSIITATYNRSNVLALTLASVRWQTFRDWELWVVGDACTDDTEQVVAAFGDARIHFVNLEQNVGEQSGPNNEGFRRSRGRYIAYLNHDDFWLPDHLETALRGIEETGADLVFALVDQVAREGPNRLVGATPTGRYEPYIFVPASSWFLRRELLEEIGPWRFYRECYEAPSENWLFRAWKAGKDMRLTPWMTVVSIPSEAGRLGVYAKREIQEHQRYYDRMSRESDFRERELTAIALKHAAWEIASKPVGTHLAGAIKHSIRSVCVALGIHPVTVRRFFRYYRKVGMVDPGRRLKGLRPLGQRERRNI